MSEEITAARVRELRALIEHHNRRYYVLDSPEISDFDYDSLMRELLTLEALNPELASPDSPTQRVGALPLKTFSPMPHRVPMLSIDNAMNEAELRDFDGRVRKLLERDEVTYCCEPKFDGLAVELLYRGGVLVADRKSVV